MPNEFYEEKEAEAILKRAAQSEGSTKMSRASLFATAQELGISAESVAQAEKEVLEQKNRLHLAQQFKDRQRLKYWGELGGYASTAALLIGIWFLTGMGHFFWPIYPIFFFAYSLLSSISDYFLPTSAGYQRGYRKWLAKQPAEADGVRSALENSSSVFGGDASEPNLRSSS